MVMGCAMLLACASAGCGWLTIDDPRHVDRSEAVRIALQQSGGTRLLSARTTTFGDAVGPGVSGDIPAETDVWAVVVEGEFERSCLPRLAPDRCPRSDRTYLVVIDLQSGAVLAGLQPVPPN
jgi:hypothetical protein